MHKVSVQQIFIMHLNSRTDKKHYISISMQMHSYKVIKLKQKSSLCKSTRIGVCANYILPRALIFFALKTSFFNSQVFFSNKRMQGNKKKLIVYHVHTCAGLNSIYFSILIKLKTPRITHQGKGLRSSEPAKYVNTLTFTLRVIALSQWNVISFRPIFIVRSYT